MKIEDVKDREVIYSKLYGLGLPHERCLAFQLGNFPTKKEFEISVKRLGIPFWISAVPETRSQNLNRLTKLDIQKINQGWKFIKKIDEKIKYKIIISQYPKEIVFKGTTLISKSGRGIAEFVTGDKHYIMTRGYTLTDPMLFDQKSITRYSNTISKKHQNNLFNLIGGIKGHLELQFGTIDNKKQITFFDYNEEEAYLEVDEIWKDLLAFFNKKRKKKKNTIYGLPASPGETTGRCVVIHHKTFNLSEKVKKGDIVISDTTTPEMTPILGNAAAIVTDLGGVTSHAAIVCRELKIPAIVGTQHATNAFRTGDFVNVDADKGLIKIIKSKKSI